MLRKGDILIDGHLRKKTEILIYDADLASVLRNLSVFHCIQNVAVHSNNSVSRLQFLHEKFDQCRFARAGLSDNEHELTLVDVKRNLVDSRLTLLVLLAHTVKIDHVSSLYNNAFTAQDVPPVSTPAGYFLIIHPFPP